jgi:ATP-dependent DNA helicase RecG
MIGLADELGSGFKNLIKYVPQYAGKEPHFIEKDIFIVLVPVPDDKVSQVTEPVNEPDKISEILMFCKSPRTRTEIQQYIGREMTLHKRQKRTDPISLYTIKDGVPGVVEIRIRRKAPNRSE